ncbi:methylmalonyl-CoA mutase family protein [Roseivirga misakiensis]|nr:methylmalonyl-CoA mutase family protein [Roseivirga misakiensis]
MNKRLFADFKSQSPEEWKEKLIVDLKGKSFDDLRWENHGITGKPFYTSNDLPPVIPQLSKEHPNTEAFGHRFWVNYQFIPVNNEKEANQKALLALQNGADGLLFELDSLADLEILFKDIELIYCHVSFRSESLSTEEIFNHYHSYLSNSAIDLNKLNGFVDGQGFHIQDIVTGLKTITLKTSAQTENYSKQIALLLGEVIDIIDHKQLEAADFFNMLSIQTHLTNDYFGEIAKHRALRLAVLKLAKTYGLEIEEPMLVSLSPQWSSEIDDPHSFMLHASTQAMAAIIGGTDGLIVNPFYKVFDKNSALAERMSRNISTILKEESYLAKNVDPSAGSYYLESMTKSLTDESIELLKSIEAKGGLSQLDLASFVESKTATV